MPGPRYCAWGNRIKKMPETFAVKQKPASPLSVSEKLRLAFCQSKGGGVYEFVIPKEQQAKPDDITTLELMWLIRKHGSENLHFNRIRIAKLYWQKGYSAYHISVLLKGQKGCGKRQIEKDLAALSAANTK